MEENIAYLKNDLSSTVELLQYSSSVKPPKYLRVLFKFYSQGTKALSKHHISLLHNLFLYLSSLIKQLQLLSLVASVIPLPSASPFQSEISKFLNLTRFDTQLLNSLGQSSLNSTSLGLIYCLAFIFCIVCLQIYIKKGFCIRPLALVFHITLHLIMNLLLLPLIIYSTVYIKYSWFSTNSKNLYNLPLSFDAATAIPFLLQLLLLFAFTYFSTIFCYTISYSAEVAYGRSHSLVSVKELKCIFATGILLEVMSEVYFLYACVFIGVYMAYIYLEYLPYHSIADNTISVGLWTSFALSAALSLISRYMMTGFEVFFCLMFLVIPMYCLVYSMLKKRSEKILESLSLTPYALELKIRKLCYGVAEINEEIAEEIRKLFKEATEKFLEFELICIWECYFGKFLLDSPVLAMKKLLKVLFIGYRPTFLKNPNLEYNACSRMECRYFLYIMLKDCKKSLVGKDFALLKYLKSLSYINSLDEESCVKLIRFIDSNLSSGNHSPKHIAEKAIKFHKVLGDNEVRLKRSLKSDEPESSSKSIYEHFKDKLINGTTLCENPLKAKMRESFFDKLMGNRKEEVNPTLIVSGHPEGIGTIIYANSEAKSMLGADASHRLVGINFSDLIPPPFDCMHKEILSRFLLFGDLIELRRSHIIIIDLRGFSIEATMDVRLAFYSYSPYFVVEFIQKPKECLLVCSPEGNIYSFSRELDGIVSRETENIQQLYPNLVQYFEKIDEIFMYCEGGKNEVMRISKLTIEFEVLYVIYLIDSEIIIKKERLNKNYVRINSIFNSPKKKTLDSEKNKGDRHFSSRKQKAGPIPELIYSPSSPDMIKRNINILKWLKRTTLITLIMFILSWTIFETNFGNNTTLVNIMNDLGKMRISILSIGTFLRSYDLSTQGFPTLFSSDQYRSLIAGECITLENFLYGLPKYSNVFDISQNLKNTDIVIYTYYNGMPEIKNTNLFEGIVELLSEANTFLNSSSRSTDSYLFIYHTSIVTLFEKMNTTNYKTLISLNQASDQIFTNINYVKIFLITPVLVLFVVSMFFFVSLEKINKRQWEILGSASNHAYLFLRSKTVDRLNLMHNIELNEDYELARAKNVHHSVWPRYFTVICLYLILVGTYILIMNYSLENPLKSLYSLRIDFAFWGGLRRSLSRRSFVFARESYLSIYSNISFTDLFTSYRDFQPIQEIYEENVMELKFIDSRLLTQTLKLNYNFDTYLEMMVSNPCIVATAIVNCSTSLISRGISSAIDTYKFNLESFANSEFTGWDAIRQPEIDSNLFVDSIDAANSWYKDNDIYYIGVYMLLIGVICAVTSMLVVLCNVMAHIQLNHMEVEMLSIYQLGYLLSDRACTKTNSNFSEIA